MSDWPFPNVIPPGKKFPNDLWALDQLSETNLPGDAEAGALLDEMADAYRDYSGLNRIQADIPLNMIEHQEMVIDHALGRLDIYEEAGIMGDVDVAFVRKTLVEGQEELKNLDKRVQNLLSRWNDAANDMFKAVDKSLDSIVKKGLAKTSIGIKKAAEVTEAAVKATRKVAKDAIKAYDAAKAAWEHDVANPVAEWNFHLAEVAMNDAKKAAGEAKAADVAAQAALVDIEASITKLSRYDLINAVNKTMKAIGIDLAAGWVEIEKLSTGMHSAINIMTDGYAKHLEKFLNNADVGSKFWKEARDSTKEVASGKAKGIAAEIKELDALARAGKTEEFLAQAALYNTPSMRQFGLIMDEFDELRESSAEMGWFALLDARWIGFALKASGRAYMAVAMRTIEGIIGDTAAAGIYDVLATLLSFTSEVVGKLLGPEVMAAQLTIELTIDVIRHGFGWRFLDDVLGMVGLSLKSEFPYDAMKEYPEFSKTKSHHKSNKKDPLILNQYDSEELAIVLDFWGKIYIDEMKRRGHKYPEYKKLKPFTSVSRISGRYINPADHPLESDRELMECKQIEHDLDLGLLVGKDDVGKGSQVASWYPKKPGLVRNLVSFPTYEASFHWPNKDGDVHQVDGWFNKSSLDPTLYNAFVLWAKSGTFGPIYNSSKSSRARNAAVVHNKADVAQWLDPKPDHLTAYLELSEWIDSNRGKKSVYYADMIILAPKTFKIEWLTNPPTSPISIYDLFTKHPDRAVEGSIEMYEAEFDAIGRWKYHMFNREFYHSISVLHKTPFADFTIGEGTAYWWLNHRPSTQDEIDKYTKVIKDGDAYKKMLDDKAFETEEQWEQFVIQKLWPHYVQVEKPFRTVFGYVQKYKSFFMQDLQAVCNAFLGESRVKAWDKYHKIKLNAHIPLNMDSAHRVGFMGSFAQLAYSTDTVKGQNLEKEIEKTHGKFLENDIVSSAISKKGMGEWAREIKNFILMTHSAKDLIPKMFGDVHCRMFVLDKPRVMIIAFRGTTNVYEWTLNVDFMSGDFMKLAFTDNIIKQDVAKHEGTWPGKMRTLLESDKVMMVHRGFLRGFTALQPGIEKQMVKYMKKYEIEDVFITGHSLGAAMTQIAGLLVPRLPYYNKTTGEHILKNPHCYMFSSPNVGDVRFQDHFSIMTGETAQIWNDGDIVTAVPPFLIPARDVTLDGFNDALDSFKSIGTKGSPWAGLMWGFSNLFQLGDLTSIFDPTTLSEFNDFSLSKLMSKAKLMFHAMNQYKPLRGGGAFFRLDYNSKGMFEEFPEDPGNTAWLFEMIRRAGGDPAIALDVHALGSVLENFQYIVKTDVDVFSLDNRNLPAWSHGGSIKPSRVPHRVIKDGTILGFAHSKHKHKAYSKIDKSDIDEVDMMVLPHEFHKKVERATKRHKHNLKDSSYHGSHYY